MAHAPATVDATAFEGVGAVVPRPPRMATGEAAELDTDGPCRRLGPALAVVPPNVAGETGARGAVARPVTGHATKVAVPDTVAPVGGKEGMARNVEVPVAARVPPRPTRDDGPALRPSIPDAVAGRGVTGDTPAIPRTQVETLRRTTPMGQTGALLQMAAPRPVTGVDSATGRVPGLAAPDMEILRARAEDDIEMPLPVAVRAQTPIADLRVLVPDVRHAVEAVDTYRVVRVPGDVAPRVVQAAQGVVAPGRGLARPPDTQEVVTVPGTGVRAKTGRRGVPAPRLVGDVVTTPMAVA